MTLAEVAEKQRSWAWGIRRREWTEMVVKAFEADPDFTLRARHDALVASLERLAEDREKYMAPPEGAPIGAWVEYRCAIHEARRLREVMK